MIVTIYIMYSSSNNNNFEINPLSTTAKMSICDILLIVISVVGEPGDTYGIHYENLTLAPM